MGSWGFYENTAQCRRGVKAGILDPGDLHVGIGLARESVQEGGALEWEIRDPVPWQVGRVNQENMGLGEDGNEDLAP